MRSAHVLRCAFVLAGAALFACTTSGGPTDELHPPGDGSGDPAQSSSGGSSSSSSSGSSKDGSAPPGDSGSGDDSGAVEPEGPPMVQLVGRFDTRDPQRPLCAYPGCRIVARFDGTHVSATLDGHIESWMDGAPSDWDVIVDGKTTSKITVTAGVQTFELATDLPAGPHTVELYKRSEAQTGAAYFLGYDFHGGTLLSPPRRSKRHIEIIGDSQAAGFGIEGVNPCPPPEWAGKYETFRKAFGADLGTMFGAEVYATVYSGKGVVRNIWVTDDETMPMLFLRANPLDPTSTWSFEWTPDVVVSLLGGNDFAFKQPVDDNAPPSLAAFTQGYDDFVGSMRSHYPNALVVLVTSPSVRDDMPEGRATRTNVSSAIDAIVKKWNAKGDAKVLGLAPNIATPDELTACNGHGTAAFHQRVANEIAAVIGPKLGW